MKLREIPIGISIGVLATGVMDGLNEVFSSTGLVLPATPAALGNVFHQWTLGNFVFDSPAAVPTVESAYAYGITGHYLIGSVLAIVFLFLTRRFSKPLEWIGAPVLYGIFTCAFAWFFLFPSVGLGYLGSNAPPHVPLLRSSFLNHVFFGVGLMLGMAALRKAESFVRNCPFERMGTPEGAEPTKLPGGILLSVGVAQAVAAGCMAITFMIGSIVLAQLPGGGTHWAGAPVAAILIASALAAYVMGSAKETKGYRFVLRTAFLLGASGGVVAALGGALSSLVLVLLGCALVGAANGTILLCRFMVAEITKPQQRGKGMSLVMTGATVGAIGGPIVGHGMVSFGAGLQLPAGVVPLIAVSSLYLIGLAVVHAGIRVDPRSLLPSMPPQAVAGGGTPGVDDAGKGRAVFAVGSLLFGQVAMVALMAVTPVHMHGHHHHTGTISIVLAVHFLGMYGMSFVSGWLADKYNRVIVVLLGSALLILACGVGLISSSLPVVLTSLFLLGLGWNFCFISGTVLLSDFLAKLGPARGKIQGFTDALVNLSSAGASLGSGVALAALGYQSLALIGVGISALPILLLPMLRRGVTPEPVAQPKAAFR